MNATFRLDYLSAEWRQVCTEASFNAHTETVRILQLSSDTSNVIESESVENTQGN